MIEVYDLRQLPEDGETIEAALERDWLDRELVIADATDDERLVATQDGHAKLHVERLELAHPGGPVIRVSGEVHAELQTACVRCLSAVALEIDAELESTLFPAPPPARPEPEGDAKKKKKKKKKEPEPAAIELEAPDEATYSNDEIDLPSLVRETILLEVDMNPSCPDEAACAARTAALLAAVNPPEEAPAVDPRWAALEALKSKLS